MRRKHQRKSKYKQYSKDEIKQLMLEQAEFRYSCENNIGGKNWANDFNLLYKYMCNFKSKVPDRDGERVVIMGGKPMVL